MDANDAPGGARKSELLASVSTICGDASRGSGTDGASLSLSGDGRALSPLWSSDTVAEVLEESQITLGEGPCVDALALGRPVLVDDLHMPTGSAAWPAFTHSATDLGVGAIFAFPLQIGVIAMGTLELYRRTAGALSEPGLAAALSAADLLGSVVLELGACDEPDLVVPHYRLAVHQAAGMLTVQLGVSIEEAMVRLRGRAFSEGRSIDQVASDLVARRLSFQEEKP